MLTPIKRILKTVLSNVDSSLAICAVILGGSVATVSALRYGSLVMDGTLVASVGAIYLLLRSFSMRNGAKIGVPSSTVLLILGASVYVVIMLSLILWMKSLYIRPAEYIILISLASSLVMVQILKFSKNFMEHFILTQIFLIGLIIRLGVLYAYPSTLGWDPWVHETMYRDILNHGWIPQGLTYSNYPVTPALVSMLAMVSSVDLKLAIMLSIGFPVLFTLLYVYLICKVLGDARVGLAGALLLVTNTEHIIWSSVALIPMSLGLVIMTFLVYLLTDPSSTMRKRVITLSIAALVIPVHTLSSIAVAIVLVGFLIGFKLHRYRTPNIYRTLLKTRVSMFFLLIFLLAIYSYWMYASGFFEFSARVLRYAFTVDMYSGWESSFQGAPYPSFLVDLENIATRLIIFLSAVGALWWLKDTNRSPVRTSIIFIALIFFLLSKGGVLFHIESLYPYRWYVFAYIIMAILAGVALIAFTKFGKVGFSLSIVILFLLSFSFMNLTPGVSPPISKRPGFYMSEIVASENIAQITPGDIITDFEYFKIFNYKLGMSTKSLFLALVYPESMHTKPGSLIVIRSFAKDDYLPVEEPPKYEFEISEFYAYSRLTSEIRSMIEEGPYNRVYDNAEVTAYQGYP